MSYVGEILGMYWDSTRSKYFSINKNVTAEAAYSVQDIKRRKLIDKRTTGIADEKARDEGRIRRRIPDPLTSGLLAREHGTGRLDGSKVLAQGLVIQAYGSNMSNPFSNIFAIHPRPDLGSSMIDMLSFVALNHSNGSTDSESRFTSARIDAVLGNREMKSQNRSEILEWYCGNPTSISVHETAQRFLATSLSGRPDRGITIFSTALLGSEDDSVILSTGPGRSRGDEVDVHSSTAAPEGSSLLFAIGTSKGILTIDKQSVEARFLSRNLNLSDDVFALEFLADNPTVLMSGGRKGVLNITDLRVPDFDQADFIKHRSSITHIKSLDTHRLIVAGLNSSLCQYDLRFRKGPERTRCTLKYPEYQNEATIQIGFDVDIESGIIAAAQEHDILHPPVQLFSLDGGHTLDSAVSNLGRDRCQAPFSKDNPHRWKLSKKSTGHSRLGRGRPIQIGEVVRCVRFVQDIEGGMKSMYASADVIVKYGWDSRDVVPTCFKGI